MSVEPAAHFCISTLIFGEWVRSAVYLIISWWCFSKDKDKCGKPISFEKRHGFHFYMMSWRQFGYVLALYIDLWQPGNKQVSVFFFPNQFLTNLRTRRSRRLDWLRMSAGVRSGIGSVQRTAPPATALRLHRLSERIRKKLLLDRFSTFRNTSWQPHLQGFLCWYTDICCSVTLQLDVLSR